MSFSSDTSPPGSSIEPDSLPGVLSALAKVLHRHQTSYALIGGLAVSVRGRVRGTRDIDLLIDVPQLKLPRLLDDLQSNGFVFDLRLVLSEWTGGVTRMSWQSQVRVDWLRPVVVPFQHVLERATEMSLYGHPVRVADAEGLILLKLAAWRPQDQEDVRGLLSRHARQLDIDWIRREVLQISAPDNPVLGEFEALVHEYHEA